MRTRIAVGVLVTVALVGLAGCSSDDVASGGDTAQPASGTDGAGEGAAATGGDQALPPIDAGAGEDGSVLPALGQVGTAGRAIVREVDLRIEVDDPAAAVEAITAAVNRAGGFLAQADLQRVDGDERLLQGTLTLRVPVDQLDATVETLAELSTTTPETSLSTQDVTAQLVDIEARLTNLRALETELRTFLAEARAATGANPDTVLAVFRQVSDVRGQIEQLEAQQSNLADLVALATIRVDLRPAAGASPVVPDGWSPAAVLRAAAHATLTTGQALANVAIWLAVFVLPLALVLGAPILAARWATRRAARRRPASAN